MGHPWPSAAKPASCRFTHGPMPAFSHRGLTGRLRSKSKADQEHSGLPAGLSGVKQRQDQKRARSTVGAGLPAMAIGIYTIAQEPDFCSRCRSTRLRCGPQDRPRGRYAAHRSLVPRQRLQGFCRIQKMCRYPCCDGITSVFLKDRVACIAGKPAPTEKQLCFRSGPCLCFYHSGRLSGRRAFDFDLRRPVKPRWPNAGITQWASRHGCRDSRVGPWMARRGGPRSNAGVRAHRA